MFGSLMQYVSMNQNACVTLILLYYLLQAEELSAKLVKYTRNDSQVGEEVKRWYWPLVKCVTVRVPNNDLLEHVTLVDLPGNGDRNKSRDEMWKGVILFICTAVLLCITVSVNCDVILLQN